MSHFVPPSIEELQALIPNYRVENLIAQGERSAVYTAVHTTLGRRVAIKILPPELSQNETFNTAFDRSAKALASVQHPNIAGVYDSGNVNGMLFSVLEYISGHSLFDVSYGKRIESLQAADLISAMSQGLHKAHQSGILHLDVKPTNVLIDDSGSAKLVDFKNALPTAAEVTAYTAPESTANPELVDQRADIFSLGVIFYELLTAQYPGEHLVPASSLANADPAFDEIIAKSLHPNPAMRYLTAEEMGRDIDQLVASLQQPAAPANPFNTGPVPLATGPVAPALGAATGAIGVARPVLATGNTAAVAINTPAATTGLNTGALTGATGAVATAAPAHNPLASIAGRPAGPVGVNPLATGGLGAPASPLGAGGLGATGARPMVKTSSGGGNAMIWVILCLVAVVGGVLAIAMSGGKEEDQPIAKVDKDKEALAEKVRQRDQLTKDRLAAAKRDKAQGIADAKSDAEYEKKEAKKKKMAALKKIKDDKIAANKTKKEKIAANKKAEDLKKKEAEIAKKAAEKAEALKNGEVELGKKTDVIATIMAEEDVPEIKMNTSKLPDPQFDVKNFIKEEREKISKKIDESLESGSQRIGPMTRKLGREMTESIVNWDKGSDGRSTLKIVKLWLADCESKSVILPLPSTLSKKAKEVLQEDLKANKFILDDFNVRPLYDIEGLRDDYSQAMRRKAHELRQKNDQGAVAALDIEDMNTTRSNKAFIETVWKKK